MAILRTVEGLVQLDICPICGFLVFWTDMDYENGKPVICRFCRVWKEEKRIEKQERKAGRTFVLSAMCSFCGRPIPSSGIFGLPTYTDVPENHAEGCPVREIMEIRLA